MQNAAQTAHATVPIAEVAAARRRSTSEVVRLGRGPARKISGLCLRERLPVFASEREAGGDDNTPGFQGIINLAQKLVAVEPRSAAATRVRARGVLRGLFPDWPPAPGAEQPGLLWWFTRLFARPFPEFSAKLNAKVTWAAGGWLMGPLELSIWRRRRRWVMARTNSCS